MTTAEMLNAAFKADPGAIYALICNRVPCNITLADSQFVPVGMAHVLVGEHYHIGTLGLINGILEVNGLPKVASKWEKVNGHMRLLGFCEYTEGETEA